MPFFSYCLKVFLLNLSSTSNGFFFPQEKRFYSRDYRGEQEVQVAWCVTRGKVYNTLFHFTVEK